MTKEQLLIETAVKQGFSREEAERRTEKIKRSGLLPISFFDEIIPDEEIPNEFRKQSALCQQFGAGNKN